MTVGRERASGGSCELQGVLGKGFRVALSAHGILENADGPYRIARVRVRIRRPVPAESEAGEPGQTPVGMYAMPVMPVDLVIVGITVQLNSLDVLARFTGVEVQPVVLGGRRYSSA
jgi:hypothetical protein